MSREDYDLSDDFDEDDDDLSSEELARLNKAREQRAKNKLTEDIYNELNHPKVYIQTVDPETGFPASKILVSGGLEYFNDPQNAEPPVYSSLKQDVPYSLDRILDGTSDISSLMNEPQQMQTPASETKWSQPPAAPTGVHAPQIDTGRLLAELGLGFLQETMYPSQCVSIACSGLTTFRVPFPCHHIVVTEKIVILVTDVRSTPMFQEIECDVDRKQVFMKLIFPDGSEAPILPPVPKTISFCIGMLRCTLFMRLSRPQEEPSETQI